MKKAFSIFIALLFLNSLAAWSQDSEVGLDTSYKDAQESMYVHYSGTLLFTGEYLFMKAYCLNAATGKPSKLSKIGYIELVNQAGKSVFKHKIDLINSVGQSDFFVPNELPSGSYKLVAYTQWMKNFGLSTFFQAPITIINPYSNNQGAVLENDKANASEVNTQITKPSQNANTGFEKFELLVSDEKFNTREKIGVVFKNNIREKGFGNYSLSVRKINDLPALPRQSTSNFKKTTSSKKLPTPFAFPVENNGSVISGRVINGKSGVPVMGKNVAISIPGKDFYFQGRATNPQGRFSFPLDSYHQSNKATFQIVEDDKETYKIEIDETPPVDYSELSFESVTINSNMEKTILQRSIYNQIENGYYSVKPDTITAKSPYKPFYYYEKRIDYNLDDFTRFSTMKETFIEIIDFVWTRKNANGKTELNVVNYKDKDETNEPPLVFIDGMLVQNHDDVLSYDPKKIKTVSFLRNSYIFGTHTYQGIILMETLTGNYQHQLSGDYYKDYELFKPKEAKEYYQQSYDETNSYKRIPDYRSQLLWEPNIVLERTVLRYDFFTSSNPGDYEIVLEGFTSEGEAVSLKKVITVEDNSLSIKQ